MQCNQILLYAPPTFVLQVFRGRYYHTVSGNDDTHTVILLYVLCQHLIEAKLDLMAADCRY